MLNESFSNDVEINEWYDYNIIAPIYSDLLDHYSESQIKAYISNPMRYHKELMTISEKMYNMFGIYHQTVSKMTAAPSLDFVLIPKYSKGTHSKDNLDKAHDIFKYKFNHKSTSRDCIFNSLLYGEYVAIQRDTKSRRGAKRPSSYATGDKIEAVGILDNTMIQPLDLRYVRFEGMLNGDYLVSFDMSYFDQFKYGNLVGEIKNYPSFFISGYKAYKKDPANKRWLILPQEKTFAYKFHSARNESHGRMLGIAALLDILFAMDYTESQRNSMYDNSSSIMYMTLPEGERKGSCSLNKDQQNNQYRAFKNAVNASNENKRQNIGRTTTLKLAPGSKIDKLENGSTDNFLTDTLTEENNTNVSTDLGLAIGALNATGDASYSSLAVNIDLMLSEIFSILEEISFQYTKLINNYLEITDTKDQIEFVYLHTSTLNGEEQFNRYKELYTLAGGSRIYLYSAATGDAHTYMKLMDYEREMEFDDKYLPHVTSFTSTMSDSLDKENPDGNYGGRPRKNTSDLTASGIATRTNGDNEMKRPGV